MDLVRAVRPQQLAKWLKRGRTVRSATYSIQRSTFCGRTRIQTPNKNDGGRFKLKGVKDRLGEDVVKWDITSNSNCPGCGVRFQTDKSQAPGYIKPPKDEDEDEGNAEEVDWQSLAERTYIPAHDRITLIDMGIFQRDQEKFTPEQMKMVTMTNREIRKSTKRKVLVKEAICSRCHGLRYQGTGNKVFGKDVLPHDFRKMLSRRLVKADNPITIIKIVDIFDFHGTFVKEFSEVVGGNYPVILALNKVDLLPQKHVQAFGLSRVKFWARKEAARFGLEPKEIVCISSVTGQNVEKVLNHASVGKNRDVYVCGTTNVGKSTFINKLLSLNKITTKRKNTLTTSKIPGTTLGFQSFNIENMVGGRLFDTPGVLNPNSLELNIPFQDFLAITPQEGIRPLTYRIVPGQSILIGAICRIDILEGNAGFDCCVFTSTRVTAHQSMTEKVAQVFDKWKGIMFKPPNSPEHASLINLEHKFTCTTDGVGWDALAVDIVIPGAGWVALGGAGKFKVSVYAPTFLKVGLRRPLCPFSHREARVKFSGHGAKRK